MCEVWCLKTRRCNYARLILSILGTTTANAGIIELIAQQVIDSSETKLISSQCLHEFTYVAVPGRNRVLFCHGQK